MSPLSRFPICRLLGLAITCVAVASTACSASASYTFTDLGLSGSVDPTFDAQGNINSTTRQTYPDRRLQSGFYSISFAHGRVDDPSTALAVTTNLPALRIGYAPDTQSAFFNNTVANAVNSSGTYVGAQYEMRSYGFPAGFLGLAISFTRDGGTKLVPVPYNNSYDSFGIHLSTAYSINDAGLIVGQSANRAFLSDGTSAWDLNTLVDPKNPFLLLSATDINDRGQIVGFALDTKDNTAHDYLLTPAATATPEPSSLMLMAVGGAILHVARRRRARGRRDAA